MGAVRCLEISFASIDHYSLKQSGRQWAGPLVDTVIEYGMEQCRTGPRVFGMVEDGKVELIMVVQVDDIVIAGSD